MGYIFVSHVQRSVLLKYINILLFKKCFVNNIAIRNAVLKIYSFRIIKCKYTYCLRVLTIEIAEHQ